MFPMFKIPIPRYVKDVNAYMKNAIILLAKQLHDMGVFDK